MATKIKASALTKQMKTHIGQGYVYGAVGQVVTTALLKSRYAMYGKKMGAGYYEKNGDFTKGKCARWLGNWAADCSGLIRACRRELGGGNVSASAQGVYNQCSIHGSIATMPKRPGVAVFVYSASAGRMTHCGLYMGGGMTEESAGVTKGVIYTKMGEGWTHWGMLDWVDYDLPADGASGGGGGAPVEPGEQPDKTGNIYYEVQRGDSLSKIAAAYKMKGVNVTWQQIAKLNNISAPWIIYKGQELKIKEGEPPQAQVWYTVQRGDSLSKIAAAQRKKGVNVTWEQIAKANGIEPPYTIWKGQQLRIK